MSLASRDQRVLWHPFTQADEWEATPPLVIAGAEGAELIDAAGNRYLDGVGSLWVGVHGHRHPNVDAAVRAQLDRVAHSTLLGLTHAPAVELAEKLLAVAPRGLSRVFYSDSGSTAVEVALKMAWQWQAQRGHAWRTRFAHLAFAYHGDTLGAVSVGGIDLFHEVYRPLLFSTVALPCPRNRENEAQFAQAAIRELPEDLCGVIVEPLVQGAAGMRMHTPAFLRPVLEAVRDRGGLVIADEVATGLGRTGTMFAMEQVGFAPDLLCVGKGLSNGYLPIAATLATEAIYDGFRGGYDRTFFHGHTFTGNPLACAAGIACLDLFEQERTLDRARDLAARIPALLAGLDFRQAGLMVGIDLEPGAPRRGHRVCMAARRHGAILRPLGDTIVLMPAPCMGAEQLERLVGGLRTALDEVPG